jgi:hypothetical protein
MQDIVYDCMSKLKTKLTLFNCKNTIYFKIFYERKNKFFNTMWSFYSFNLLQLKF